MNSFNSTPSSTGPSRDSRLRELELLFELSRAVVRARSVGDVAEAALDTVIEATRADRASLLLFDEQNVTRFRAWRRLSPRYRAAVEGHSPWGPEDSDAIPIAVADVLTDQSLETVRDTITGEGIRALAFVPLIHDDRVLGKFMVYYDQPHNFSPDELRLAETIANQVAFAIHRSQTDEALRESEERFRRLADSMPQIVWTALPNRHCEYVNRQWSDYTGLPREEAYGQGWLSIVHPEDRERTCQASRAFVVDEPYFIEHRLRGKDGSYRWFLVRGTPVRDEARRVIRWFGTSTDIHDQKLAQRRLEKHAEELREADRHKDEFLAVLGHELRNPLAAIRSGVSLLSALRQDDARFSWVQTMLTNNVKHLASLLDDLLDLNRISRGTIRLRRESTQITSVIARALETAAPEIRKRRHELRIDVPADVHAFADPTRVEQIAANLIVNAAKYTPDEGRIEIEAESDDEWTLFRVRDNGIGIPPAEQRTIFEAFQRVRASGASPGGLGIGLAIVKRLSELHGGSVSVRSDEHGSEFTVRLPAKEAVAPPAQDDTAPTAPLGAPHHVPTDAQQLDGVSGLDIVVVEDNEDVARSLSLVLEEAGCHVTVAHDGDEALEVAHAEMPDAMLIDIGLPRRDGHEVARELRANPAFRDTFLVALSGFGHEEARRASREAGFNEHVAKPADPEALFALISEHCRSARGHGNDRSDR